MNAKKQQIIPTPGIIIKLKLKFILKLNFKSFCTCDFSFEQVIDDFESYKLRSYQMVNFTDKSDG